MAPTCTVGWLKHIPVTNDVILAGVLKVLPVASRMNFVFCRKFLKRKFHSSYRASDLAVLLNLILLISSWKYLLGYSLELPHWGNYNEYYQHIFSGLCKRILMINCYTLKKIVLSVPPSLHRVYLQCFACRRHDIIGTEPLKILKIELIQEVFDRLII